MGRGLAALLGSLLIVGVLGAMVFGALGLTSTTGVISAVDVSNSPVGGTMTVSSKAAEGGFQLFGITLHQKHYHVDVSAVVPIECIALDAAGRQQLHSGRGCPDVPPGATLSGGGITAMGDGITTIRVPVSRACYEATALGSPWPSLLPACTSD